MIQEVETEQDSSLRANVESYPRRWLIGAVVVILIVGATFYHFVEGWKLLDSFYFCAITLATIGYGDFAPKTDLGKLFTVFYVFTGLGVIAAYIEIVWREGLQRRYERVQRRRSARPRARHQPETVDQSESTRAE
jgi:hypothetical protein